MRPVPSMPFRRRPSARCAPRPFSEVATHLTPFAGTLWRALGPLTSGALDQGSCPPAARSRVSGGAPQFARKWRRNSLKRLIPRSRERPRRPFGSSSASPALSSAAVVEIGWKCSRILLITLETRPEKARLGGVANEATPLPRPPLPSRRPCRPKRPAPVRPCRTRSPPASHGRRCGCRGPAPGSVGRRRSPA